MKFKTHEAALEYKFICPLLRIGAEYFEELSYELAGVEPTVTRILGRVKGDSGVHAAYRAIDFRGVHRDKAYYTTSVIHEILDKVNKRIPRTDGRETIIYHAFGGSPDHFHLQVSYDITVYSEMLLLSDV